MRPSQPRRLREALVRIPEPASRFPPIQASFHAGWPGTPLDQQLAVRVASATARRRSEPTDASDARAWRLVAGRSHALHPVARATRPHDAAPYALSRRILVVSSPGKVP